MKRQLLYYGNPFLRKKAIEVENITPEIRQLVQDMIETMDASRGVGLAAPQIGEPWKLVIIRPEVQGKDGEFLLGEVEVYINPKLSSPSKETIVYTEGCLSVPGLHMDVIRPKTIHIEAMDLEGKKISKDLDGFKARQIMHENDHLNGVLFVDRLDAKQKKQVEPILAKIKNKS